MHLGAIIYGILALASAVSILAKRPWTLLLARRNYPPEVWSLPLFLETNYVMTALWVVAFGIAAWVTLMVSSYWVYVGVGIVLFVLARTSQAIARWYVAHRTPSG